jgi:hypothetical protein
MKPLIIGPLLFEGDHQPGVPDSNDFRISWVANRAPLCNGNMVTMAGNEFLNCARKPRCRRVSLSVELKSVNHILAIPSQIRF